MASEGEWELESEESWDRRRAGVGVGIQEDIVMENYGEIRPLFIHIARLCLKSFTADRLYPAQYGRASANVIARITVIVPLHTACWEHLKGQSATASSVDCG